MSSVQQHFGVSGQVNYSRPRRWRFLCPLTTRNMYPYWNRENWQAFAHGVVNVNEVPGPKVLGQNTTAFFRGEKVIYQVPDGYSAYVTIVITNIATARVLVTLAVVTQDALNPTDLTEYIFRDRYLEAFGVLTVTLPLGAGNAVRAYDTTGTPFNVNVFGWQIPEQAGNVA